MRTTIPKLHSNIGKSRSWRNIRGKRLNYVIEDEIVRHLRDYPNKVVVLQKLVPRGDDLETELRLGYYMIGVKPGRQGRWVWGQYCTIIPAHELDMILREAKRRGWLKLK